MISHQHTTPTTTPYEPPTSTTEIEALSLGQIEKHLALALRDSKGLSIESLAEQPLVNASHAAAAAKRHALLALLPLLERHQLFTLGAAATLAATPSTVLVGTRAIDWSTIRRGTLPFLAFPPEIQSQIMEHAFHRSEPLVVDAMLTGIPGFIQQRGAHAALLTCRYMYHAHLRSFLAANTWSICLRRLADENHMAHFVERWPYFTGQPVSWASIDRVILESARTHGGFEHCLRVLRALQGARHRQQPLDQVVFDLRQEHVQFKEHLTIEEPATDKIYEILQRGGVQVEALKGKVWVLEYWENQDRTLRTHWQETILVPQLERGLEQGVDGLTVEERKAYLKQVAMDLKRPLPSFVDEVEAEEQRKKELRARQQHTAEPARVTSSWELDAGAAGDGWDNAGDGWDSAPAADAAPLATSPPTSHPAIPPASGANDSPHARSRGGRKKRSRNQRKTNAAKQAHVPGSQAWTSSHSGW